MKFDWMNDCRGSAGAKRNAQLQRCVCDERRVVEMQVEVSELTMDIFSPVILTGRIGNMTLQILFVNHCMMSAYGKPDPNSRYVHIYICIYIYIYIRVENEYDPTDMFQPSCFPMY